MIYLKLFIEFLYVGLFSLGGGYATIPLIQNRIIDVHGWITTQQFIDMITISQMTPGPLTVNISTFVGLRIGGILGSFVATMGAALVGVSMTLVVTYFYQKATNRKYWELFLKGLRISSTALIMLATVSIFELLLVPEAGFSTLTIGIFVVLLLGALKFKLDTYHILIVSSLAGFILF